jgi:AraC-like DNA-binding protein
MPVAQDWLQHNILYSCTMQQKRGHEQFVEEHALGYILAGEVHFFTNKEIKIYKQGMIGLIRRNQLAKTIKVPPADGGEFKAINILLNQDMLRKYSREKDITVPGIYKEPTMIELSPDPFIKSYFSSLVPYFDQPQQLTKSLAALKTEEAIELLLRHDPSLKDLLFDFSTPHKIDLEAFMNRNFTYHVSLSHFAKMTGRSLATFKRDFQKTFAQTPEKWLQQKRLERAHYLIAHRKQSPGAVYLEVGFENLSHFSASFKNFYGYNPSSIPGNK